jgi:hypothetical protein
MSRTRPRGSTASIRSRLRPHAYPRSKLLQCDRGLYHPACLASPSECLRQGPFAPRALPRFIATTSPSVRRSPSAHFVSRLARLPCSAGFLRGARRPSLFPSMALHTCHRPLPRREMPTSDRLRWALLPSQWGRPLGSRSFVLTRSLLDVHAPLRPVCSLAPPSGVLSVSFTLARVTQAMRRRSLTASGLSPYGPMDSSRHHTPRNDARAQTSPARLSSFEAPAM